MMQQAQKHLVTAHTDCVNATRDVLSGQEKGHLDDSTNICDEGKDAQGQMVDDNMQQTTNAVMDDPLHHDQVINTETRMNRTNQMHNMLTTPCNKQATQQLMHKQRARNNKCSNGKPPAL
jgi:hypothetical protein